MNCFQRGSYLTCETLTKEPPMELAVISNFYHRRPHEGSNLNCEGKIRYSHHWYHTKYFIYTIQHYNYILFLIFLSLKLPETTIDECSYIRDKYGNGQGLDFPGESLYPLCVNCFMIQSILSIDKKCFDADDFFLLYFFYGCKGCKILLILISFKSIKTFSRNDHDFCVPYLDKHSKTYCRSKFL